MRTRSRFSGDWLPRPSRPSRIRPGQSRDSSRPQPVQVGGEREYWPVDIQPNSTGVTIICPGGGYPALWTRDFAMSLDCGLIDAAEILPQLRLFAKCQNGEKERAFPTGHHSALGHRGPRQPYGRSGVLPGSYSSGNNQGGGAAGPLPPIDDHFYFTHIAYAVWCDTGDAGFLDEPIDGVKLLDRLERAFSTPPADPQTGAAVTDSDRRAVGFGFEDWCTCWGRCRSPPCCVIARPGNWPNCAGLAARPKRPRTTRTARPSPHFARVFADPAGATAGFRRQPCAAAGRLGHALQGMHLGVLPAEAAKKVRATVADAVRRTRQHHRVSGGRSPRPVELLFRPQAVLGTRRRRRKRLSERGFLAHAHRMADRGPLAGRSAFGPAGHATGSSRISAKAISQGLGYGGLGALLSWPCRPLERRLHDVRHPAAGRLESDRHRQAAACCPADPNRVCRRRSSRATDNAHAGESRMQRQLPLTIAWILTCTTVILGPRTIDAAPTHTLANGSFRLTASVVSGAVHLQLDDLRGLLRGRRSVPLSCRGGG